LEVEELDAIGKDKEEDKNPDDMGRGNVWKEVILKTPAPFKE
jgi:hypothetical protein